MNLIPDNFWGAAALITDGKEELLYTLARARGVLNAPEGRYSAEVIEQVRSMVKSIEERFPGFLPRRAER